MLAKQNWYEPAPVASLPDLDYTGFPFWIGLAAEPNREQRSADWLKDKLNIHVYWPCFVVQRHIRGRSHAAHFRSVIPGLMLAPAEFLDIDRREVILNWSHLRIVRFARQITKSEVEVIRTIEAGLNMYRYEKPSVLAIGDRVHFLDDVKAAFLGDGVICEIANGGRIGIKLNTKLIGRDKIYSTAAELEVI